VNNEHLHKTLVTQIL